MVEFDVILRRGGSTDRGQGEERNGRTRFGQSVRWLAKSLPIGADYFKASWTSVRTPSVDALLLEDSNLTATGRVLAGDL